MMKSHCLPHRRRLPPPPLPLPELMDDAITEILLRLPPDDPACLVHASLVCKLWHHILSEPTFPDRYREFHRTPPLLGFLASSYTNEYDESEGRFVPTTPTRIPFRQPVFGCRAVDCRHGRVLLDMVDGLGTVRECLAVWDPVTGDHKLLGNPDQAPDPFSQAGAVLCAAAGCNHRGCHSGPFQVVFVCNTSSYSYVHGTSTNATWAWVYSSETAAWSTPVSVQYDYFASIERKHAAIVGEQIYFLLSPGARILMYDLGKGCLTVIDAPCTYRYRLPGMLMAMEDGCSLGFAGIMDDFTALQLWATKVNSNGSMEWVQDRVILLNNLLVPNIGTVDTCDKVIDVIGLVEGVGILLLSIEDGTGFMFELKSERFRELCMSADYYRGVFLPYFNFYISGE